MTDAVDPALLTALPEIMARSPNPVTLDVLATVRDLNAAGALTDEQMRRDGAIDVERRRVPGADGDITVLIARPAGAAGPLPGVVHLHGGGLMSGDERSDMPVVLDWVEQAGVVVVSADIFRDEDVDYACRIWRAGGSADLHVWTGGYHGFDVLVPDAAVSRAARAARVEWLRRLPR